MTNVLLDGDVEEFEASVVFVAEDKTVAVAVAGVIVPAGLAELDSIEAVELVAYDL